MRKSLASLLILLFLTSLVALPSATVTAESKTIVVPDDSHTIQEAINAADAGDTIFVKRGTYIENPVINKSISLVGEDRDATVIDVTAGLKVQRDNVTVTGLTIFDGYDGISVGANYCNISGNKIKQATHGIVVFGNNNHITGNTLESIGLSSAIQLNYANENIVKNNYIESCVEGIQIWQNSNNNTITENTIKNCQDTAVNFQYSNNNKLIGNNITNSGLGTSIYGSNNNSICKNNYVNNTIQFSVNEGYYLTFGNPRSVNIISENYWSDYNGTDANRDGIGGIGDTPYVIDAYNQDNSPILLPISLATPTATTTPSPPISGPTSSPTPSPSIPEFTSWVILSMLSIIVVIAGLLVYFKKRQRSMIL
jgi:parallel beta-helix repeat protein